MLIDLLAWFYISLICLVWGRLVLDLAGRIFHSRLELGLPLTCLAGLSLIGSCCLWLSLITPLDGRIQAFLFLPVGIYLLNSKKRRSLFQDMRNSFSDLVPWAGIGLFLCLLLLLTLSAYRVSHPDTLAYHAQSVAWFRQYPAVPGLVHLRQELGFQSLWFASLAAFSLPIRGLSTAFYLNGAVLSWFFIYVLRRLFPQDRRRAAAGAWGWLLLLVFSLFSWTDVRLTAASASPDFIVTLYLLAAIRLAWLHPVSKANRSEIWALSFFASAAVATKLSAVAILILPILLLIFPGPNKNRRSSAVCLATVAILLIPLLIRNYIASGYPLYPARLGSFLEPDWKLPASKLDSFQEYITAYARFPVTRANTAASLNLPGTAWIPLWWKHLAIAERCLIASILLLVVLNLLFFRKWLRRSWISTLPIGIAVTSGVIFWFVKAPDPRFGEAWLIALVCLLAAPWSQAAERLSHSASPGGLRMAFALVCLGVFSYTVYRWTNFFEKGEWLVPAGVPSASYRLNTYNGIKVSHPFPPDSNCAFSPVPCVGDSLPAFEFRGKTVERGFRALRSPAEGN